MTLVSRSEGVFMNIKDAKNQIKNTVQAYLSKNEHGEYRIPLNRQRPVFLLGAPGIGKTAIMEQISKELGIAFISYSMTHHTRQSALGLPFISEKEYQGKTYRVSEYTMSEIISAIYDKMEVTGLTEGILFLDEINCVSETLAPAMLQFLQYKVFGQHRVPDGWIVAAAGNPPEFNSSVREFDIVTMDRLKVMTAEPDYGVWREYAAAAGIHNSIISYLDIKKTDFYIVQTTVDGMQIVTPRAWEDLSDMIHISEDLQLPIDDLMTGQYLQNPRTAKDFAIYYELYNKYKSEYQIEDILLGNWSENLRQKAQAARFDERMSLISILLDNVSSDIRQSNLDQEVLQKLTHILSDIRKTSVSGTSVSETSVSGASSSVTSVSGASSSGTSISETSVSEASVLEPLSNALSDTELDFENQKQTGLLSDRQKETFHQTIKKLNVYLSHLKAAPATDFSSLKSFFDEDTSAFKQHVLRIQTRLENLFSFAETVYGEDNEILVIVSSLTGNRDCVSFINQFGCEKYFKHNKELLFFQRQQEIENRLQQTKE